MGSSSQASTTDLRSPNRFQVRLYPTTSSGLDTLSPTIGYGTNSQVIPSMSMCPTWYRDRFGAAVILRLPQMPSIDRHRPWLYRENARRGGCDLRCPCGIRHRPYIRHHAAFSLVCFLEGSVARGGYCCGHEYLQVFALNRRWLTKRKRQTANGKRQAIKRLKHLISSSPAHPSPTYYTFSSTVALPPHSTLPPLTSLLPSYFPPMTRSQ